MDEIKITFNDGYGGSSEENPEPLFKKMGELAIQRYKAGRLQVGHWVCANDGSGNERDGLILSIRHRQNETTITIDYYD